MKVITPLIIDDTTLISSSVVEDDAPAWSSVTNYAVAAQVLVDHVIYESVQTPNTNHPPATSALYWARIGPSNRWAMFDTEISTATTDTDALDVTVKGVNPGGLALINVTGSSADVTLRDGPGGAIIDQRTITLDGTVIVDWYQYFWEPYAIATQLVILDLPPYPNAHLTVSLSGVGEVSIGQFVIGRVYALGTTLSSPTLGIIDYSRKDVSPTGVITLVKRRYSDRLSVSLVLDSSQIGKVRSVLTDLRATPCVWSGADEAIGADALAVFGFYRDFSIDVAYASHALCNLEIEGMS